MKVFREENGKEVVYVQMQDLGFINSTSDPIPASVFTQLSSNGPIIGARNRFDYVRFENETDVNYFRSLDYIIDFNECKDLGLEEIEEKGSEVEESINSLVDRYNAMGEDERRRNAVMLSDYEKLNYKMQWLSFIYGYKQDKKDLPFPDQPIQKRKTIDKK